jgi:hypothetical protein
MWFWITNGATVNWRNLSFDGAGQNILTAVHYGDAATPGGPTGTGTIQDVVFQNINYAAYLGIGLGVYHNSHINVFNVTMSNMGRIGVHVRGSGGMGATATINGFYYAGKGAVDGLDYGVEFGGAVVAR